MKRLLSGLLSLVMVFSLTPSTIAFADDEKTDNTPQSEEGTSQETSGSSEKIGGAETTSKSEENSESVDLNTMSSDELFEYIMNVSSDDMDELYDKYPNLNDLISKLSEDQQNQLAKKFGNTEEDVESVDNNTDNEAQPASDNSNGDDSTVASGTCGDKLKWALDSDGTLTISGTGTMYNYDYYNKAPWVGYNVTNIIINKDVTSIGDNAFSNDYYNFNIDSVLIPSTVRSIGSNAFYNNIKLTSITLPENLETIGSGAFNCCTSLQSITIPSNVTTIGASAFNDCTSLQSITIPSSVTAIEKETFMWCRELTSITIPDSVTTIEAYAFDECVSLQSITLYNTLTVVDNNSFYGCSNVKDIYFYGTQSQWDGIKENVLASMGTTQEPSVHFFVDSGSCGDGVTWTLDGDGKLTISGEGTITKYLWKTADIKSIEIKEGVTSIGESAFYGCNAITSVTLPSTLKSIGKEAFYGSFNLTDLTIPDGVESIDEKAFYGCNSLTTLTLPSSLTTVADNSFYGCNDLTDIYFYGTQDQWDSIKENVLKNVRTNPTEHIVVGSGSCGDNLTWILDGNGILTISGTGKMYDYYSGPYPWNSNDVTKVIIADGATSIGGYAFYNCINLESVVIPNTVNSIGACAFGRCEKLKNIVIPNSVINIADYAFYICSNLESITLYNSLTTVGDPPFVYCSNVKDIYFYGTQEQWNKMPKNILISFDSNPTIHLIVDSGKCGDNLTWTLESDGKLTISGTGKMYDYSVAEMAPWYKKEVTSVEIEEGVTSIGNSAFNVCTSLKDVNIPSSVTTIGKYAFSGCMSLKSVTIPSSVTSIGDNAFGRCENLKSIDIPSSVETIGEEAFNNCINLANVTIQNGVTSIGYGAFEECNSLTSITIPDSVTSIGEYAFSNSINLVNVTLPCRFKNAINNNWFDETKVTNPTVGNHELIQIIKKDATCTEDGYQAYWQCKKCQRMFTDNIETKEITAPIVINAGHKYGEVKYIWSKDYKECTATRVCEKGDDTQTETKPSTSIVLRNQSCTESELTEYSATFENDAFKAQTTEVETEKATGHKLTEFKKVNATCTTAGQAAYWECQTCKSMFSDAEGKNKLDAIVTIPATGHKLTKVKKVDATCTTAGQEAYWECQTCKKMFSDDKGTISIDKPSTIDASGHKLTEVKRVAATCTTAGHEAYWKCSTCDGMFSDAEGKKKLDKIVTIPATGHSYGEVTYTWSSDHKKCTATRECENCHDKDTETVNSTSEVARKQSCTESELTKYSVTFKNDVFKAQTTEVETADAKGHALTKVDEIKATCENAGQAAYWECSDCHKKFSDKDGNDEIESPVVIKALGHKFAEVKKVGATCTTAGYEAYWKCDTCESLFSDSEGKNKIDEIVTIPATGHNLTKVSKQDSTASKEGNIAYWYCDECDKYYSDEGAEKEIKKADTVIAKVAPVIIKGDGVTVTVGEKKELSFTSDASYDDFIRAEVDGKILDSDNYTVKSGSTIVTLKSDYVASLEEGKHTLSIVSQSGTATAHFTVTKKKADTETTNTAKKSDSKQSTKKSTNTGVQSNMGLYISLIMISMIGLVVLVRRRSEQ